MERLIPKGGIELLEEGDYQQFLIELSAFQLAYKSSSHPEAIAHTLDLLNSSYDLFGEGVITAESGVEVIQLPTELQAENPLLRETRKVYHIEQKFTHSGHGLGFNFNMETKEFMLSFTDTQNPFDVQIGEFDGDDIVTPQPVRTIHVPVFVPHNISMLNGYRLESQLAA